MPTCCWFYGDLGCLSRAGAELSRPADPARLIGPWLSERLGQPFLIENRPGAGNNIATEAVVRAPADGHTLLVVDAAHAINATLYDKLNFNFARDIAPISGLIDVPLVMGLNPAVPAKSVPEFIAIAPRPRFKVRVATIS